MNADPDTVALFQARLQAIRLRNAGMPYPSIVIAIRVYHGIDLNMHTLRDLCTKAGCPPRPRAGSFQRARA